MIIVMYEADQCSLAIIGNCKSLQYKFLEQMPQIRMNNDKYIKLSEMLRSVAHPVRLAIIQLLYESQRMSVKGIYDKLKMAQPIVSRHLSIMRNSGLLKREQEGNNTYYRLCTENQLVGGLYPLLKK